MVSKSNSLIPVIPILVCVLVLLTGCQTDNQPLPTLAPSITAISLSNQGSQVSIETTSPTATNALLNGRVPATWTPLPSVIAPTSTSIELGVIDYSTSTPQSIPTRTPIPPTPTPTPTTTPTTMSSATPDIRPLNDYAREDVIPIEVFPRPPGDNGWGMHWIPTNKQEPGVIDRFVSQLSTMHIKWLVFLNDNSNIGDNDYLVDRLVAAGIMPVMRVYRSNVLPYDGDLGRMVAHYRAKGVYYFQLYNEPNVIAENDQGFPNPFMYAVSWAASARDVIDNGGYPGIGAFSPGGEFNHYRFLELTLQSLAWNGDLGLLNRTWVSVHNYHGLRAMDDPDGFLLFRRYDEIVRRYLGRSMPMIGTEGGSYSTNQEVARDVIANQYSYMRVAEPYFLAFSYWVLANKEGGSWDTAWEYQALFQSGFTHPVVTDFFYRNRR